MKSVAALDRRFAKAKFGVLVMPVGLRGEGVRVGVALMLSPLRILWFGILSRKLQFEINTKQVVHMYITLNIWESGGGDNRLLYY